MQSRSMESNWIDVKQTELNRGKASPLQKGKKVEWNKDPLPKALYVALFPTNDLSAVIQNVHKTHTWPGHKKNRETKRLLIQLQML